MAQVNVTINNRSYRMACDDGQEDHLRGLAKQLDDVIEQMRASFGEIGDQRLTVMSAIALADTLSEARRQIDGLESELAQLRESSSAAKGKAEVDEAEITRALETVAERIEVAAGKLTGSEGG